jgi:hypothetical protein
MMSVFDPSAMILRALLWLEKIFGELERRSGGLRCSASPAAAASPALWSSPVIVRRLDMLQLRERKKKVFTRGE